jgi:hypothetical protein
MTDLLWLPFVLAFAGVSLANVLWYHLKSVLRARGYPVSRLHNHFQDFRHLEDLLVTTGDSPEGRRLRQLRTLLYAAIGMTLAGSLLMMGSMLF